MSEDMEEYGQIPKYKRKPSRIFEIDAKDLIANNIDLREKMIEIEEADGELRIINKDLFFANNNKYAFVLREAIMLSNNYNIFFSVEGFENNPHDDSTVSKDTANNLIKDKKIILEKLKEYLRKPGRSEN